MRQNDKNSAVLKLLGLSTAVVLTAAIVQSIFINFLASSDALRYLYNEKWHYQSMPTKFRKQWQQRGASSLSSTDANLLINSFQPFLISEGYQIKSDEKTFATLFIDDFVVVDLSGEVIAHIGGSHFSSGNLFSQLNNAEREDLAEALLNKDPFGSSRSADYSGRSLAISLFDHQQQVIGALMIRERITLENNLIGLWYGTKTVFSAILERFNQLIFACLLFAIVMSIYLTRRLRNITAGVVRWQQNDFSHPIIDHGRDELNDCVETLNSFSRSIEMAIAQQQLNASYEERQKLAIELHDTVKQRLFAVNLTLALLEKQLPETSPVQVELGKLTEQCEQAFAEMQNTIDALSREHLSTCSQLEAKFTAWQHTHSIKFDYSIDRAITAKAYDLNLIWRIIFGGLQNVVKHSGADHVTLSLVESEQQVKLTLSDNGIGLAESFTMGQGLSLLHQQITSQGGKLNLTNHLQAPEHRVSGCTLSVQIPRGEQANTRSDT